MSKKINKSRKKNLLEKTTVSQAKASSIVQSIACKIFKFQVQKERILDPYFLDVYIKSIKVGIEIDGGIHNQQEGYDNRRDSFLMEKYDVRVFRFKNEDVGTIYFERAIFDICLDGLYNYLNIIRGEALQRNVDIPIKYPSDNKYTHRSFSGSLGV